MRFTSSECDQTQTRRNLARTRKNEIANTDPSRIVEKPVVFPQEPPISPEAKDIIRSFCNTDRSRRLGNVSGGAKKVKEHPFFRGVDWDGVYNRRQRGPIIPPIRFPGDAQCFDIYPEEDANSERYTDELRMKYDDYFKDF